MEHFKNTFSKWTPAENKMFENALAVHDDEEAPDRWRKVAAMIPGKTAVDVMKQYRELEADVSNIEAGLIPVPEYSNNPCHGRQYSGRAKISSSTRLAEPERKKGVPWTEKEHKLFLMGLEKHGKGDWKSIANNFVTSRSATQVASHAQKFFIRQQQLQLSGGKDKRRASIHDITTVNIDGGDRTPSPENQNPPPPELQTHFQCNHHQQQPNNGSGADAAFGAVQELQNLAFQMQNHHHRDHPHG